MEKRILGSDSAAEKSPQVDGLDLAALSDVEVSSENPDYPIEAALLPGFEQGWRAGTPGQQSIRLLFKQPQHIQTVKIAFTESHVARTQQYVLRISQDNGESFQEIVRQQWNFSPNGSTSAAETHRLTAAGVDIVELLINPDIANPNVFATLQSLRVS